MFLFDNNHLFTHVFKYFYIWFIYPGYDSNLYLMVRLQSLNFGKYRVSLHCHYFQIHCDPEC